MGDLEVGLSLPNVGGGASLDRCRQVARLALDGGIDSLWMTDHLLVGPDAAEAYGEVVEPLTGLSVLAGELGEVSLGTSILLLPLRDPVAVAKQAVVLQEATGGRFHLGVGIGWHEPEYDMLGVDFDGRGELVDEALALIRALWRGDGRFSGNRWAFDDAAFGPLPRPQPAVWIGGNSDAAQRRAREYGDVWHPFMPAPDDIRRFREQGDVPVRPRVLLSFDPDEASDVAYAGTPDDVAGFLASLRDAGAAGFVISLEPAPHEDASALDVLIDGVLASR